MLSAWRVSLTPGVHLGEPPLLYVMLQLTSSVLHWSCCSRCYDSICCVLLLTWQVCCRYGFLNNLTLGGPTPIGARKAPLSEKYLSMMQEVALNEQVSTV